jgi:tetratricopeptide (TPR) repeat protein
MQRAIALAVLLFAVPASAQHHNRHDPRALEQDPRLAPGQIAPVLEGLGRHHHAVTTDSERAQLFFDQGLKLTYGFNHQEALRAFKEAARIDPDCAMAYWGWALVLGPNLNLPMSPEVVEQAWDAVQLAAEKREGAGDKERAMIEALVRRYSADPSADRGALNAACAKAMAEVHAKFPDDTDVATLYAAALMNLSPWDYWNLDGSPKGQTETILKVLERAIEQDEHHEGALHYYIHAVEPVDARRGERAADLLRGLAPGAGHLVHMPSHIYMQTGRYAESYEVNTLAAQADEGYITQCRAQGIYPLNYYPHNVHFLAWAAIMQGRSAEALAASRKVAAQVPHDMHGNDWALYQTFLSMPLYTLVRFGKWEEVLNEPRPPENTRYWEGIWHYARGMAHAHTGKLQTAREDWTALRKISDEPTTPEVIIGFNSAGTLLQIASHVLAGEIAAGEADHERALYHLGRAVRLEDSLTYNEPPDWYYPVRHTLGAVLLEAGLPVEAEVVYADDLRKHENNGYALHGLLQAVRAQGRDGDAAAIEQRLKQAWSAADAPLRSSRY